MSAVCAEAAVVATRSEWASSRIRRIRGIFLAFDRVFRVPLHFRRRVAREQVAGAIILDRLRERIVSGIYFGLWRPGERLPSIREIADAEGVDRKTAAAAYRRLEREGLVRVHPRSGVYLRVQRAPEAATPLEKLYRRWLENTYARASALGLRTNTILHLVTAVAEIERLRVPVIEQDWPQAETIAAELRERAGINATPVPLSALMREDAAWLEAPFVVTTPYCRGSVLSFDGAKPLVEATLSQETVRELRDKIREGELAVIVANESIAAKLRPFILRGHHFGSGSGKIAIVTAGGPAQVASETEGAHNVFLWPGAPAWVQDAIGSRATLRALNCISDETLARVRAAILDAAIARERDVIWREASTATTPAQQPLLTTSTVV
ncbi:MAG: GntR family transcriptional regulator [Gemmatimonadota bacterium]